MSRIALVTGASGFVGSHLADHLHGEGWEVRALVRRSSNTRWLPPRTGFKLVYGDAADAASLGDAVKGVHSVFHVAGVTRADHESVYRRVNIQGTKNLVQASRDAEVQRFVLVSSLAAGGSSPQAIPRREEDEDRPRNPYGRSKLGGEEALIQESGDMPWTILRPPAVYGPRDEGFFLLTRIVARGWKIRFTGPVQPVGVVQVKDLVTGIIDAASAETTLGKKYYVGNSENTTWTDLADLMAAGLGRRVREIVIPRSLIPWISRGSGLWANLRRRENPLPENRIMDLFARAWICDSSRARKDFGFVTSVDLTEGIHETMQWYKKEGWI